MSRLERPAAQNPNPAEMFLEWKSNDKCFEYYDKESKEKVKVELPLKFAFLEHYHTVKGWHDATQTGIYSNEVFGIGYEELDVKTFKGLKIAEGLYKENKTIINSSGGKYHRSIYGVLEDGRIINIALKGASVGGIKADKSADKKEHEGYSDFCRTNSNTFERKWILIDGIAEGKSGSVKYSIPVFSMEKDITDKEDAIIVESANILQDFVNSKKSKEVSKTIPEDIEVDVNEEDIF
jgi:hypothetical protein